MNKVTKKGFTLIELIVVIAVLAVLGLLLVPQISGYIDASQATTCLNNRKLVERAITVAEAQSGKKQTFTKPEEVAAIPGSLYDGGKICPKDGTITIVDGKVNCSIHKESTGGSTFIKDGSILDEKEFAIDFDATPENIPANSVIKITVNGVDYWVKCANSSGCKKNNFPSVIPFDTTIPNYWKEIALEWNTYNNYEKNDIIKFGDKYYYYKTSGLANDPFKDPSKNSIDFGEAVWNDTTSMWEVPHP